ncbi:uncharacterized protein N7446_006000 [Penicillium canescens]|uniref:uncharacterized protein n=1 Tax=Penicillium canescens TaxID=5083 RepID=UPI0026E0C794|nr:uncharacterized protein N7446_006000 [Penicillium canescens]KAJ6061880.1 hypothetical protein N7446_006000 [Penicillium canescens]KAJ6065130.1 hypothetical protein N7444_000783 [Penicillium canescens]
MSGIVETSTMASTSTFRIHNFARRFIIVVIATPDPHFPLRAFQHAETFALRTVPQTLARFSGMNALGYGFWSGADPTIGAGDAVATAANAAANMAGDGTAGGVGQEGGYYIAEFLSAVKKVGGFFGYLTSLWSFACLVEALILNRITIYASTRRHLRLGWERRLALRLIPILLFVFQILSLLRGIRCQTSPDFSTFRYGKPGKQLIFDYSSDGGALYSFSSKLLGWESVEQSCSAVKMGRAGTSSPIPYGSFSLLWPTFLLLCGSHFAETLSCALQGKPVMTETGMSIFEHSLAFAEAESMISKSIGLGMFGLPKQSPLSAGSSGEASASVLQMLTRSQVLERMNVTPELLLIALISCCNSLTSHLLDVAGKQSRYRLLNTAFWGACFMTAMLWGLEGGPPISIETGVLKFPTVCIVGFIPHILVLLGIVICVTIYGIALTITAFSLHPEYEQPVSFRERFMLAHENMQGSNQIRSIRVNRHEDFYTTLLRIGYVALTAASEAVFLNEGKAVIARRMTWLEEDRLAEIEASRKKYSSYGNWQSESNTRPIEALGFASFDLPQEPPTWESGYGREKKIEKQKNGSRAVRSQAELGGVGAVRVSIRLWHVASFFRAISLLVLRWAAFGLSTVLDRLGFTARPMWLKRLIEHRQQKAETDKPGGSRTLNFWILSDDGEIRLPENGDFDVELEMRKRERTNRMERSGLDEGWLDDRLYGWWRSGGAWGNQDHSSDYQPTADDDFDTTSMVSMSTNASESEWEDYPSDDGRRTPTQREPYADRARSVPLQDPLLDMSTLARLLDPRDRESREEARILAAHLKPNQDSPRIMTRSRYQKEIEREKSKIIFSSRLHQLNAMDSGSNGRKPTADEESEILEKLILSRRAETSSNADASSWESGATGLGPNGPPCVVCQTSPRAIITWPCRCLCICEDCRVSLAMNNFGSCVTCRQEVGGFMRLWVP